MTVCVAIVASMLVSLTLTPMMCAYLLKPSHEARPEPRFARAGERFCSAAVELGSDASRCLALQAGHTRRYAGHGRG